MALPRTFVGFSRNDVHHYELMVAWKEREHIDFNFCNCELDKVLESTNENYIKSLCRERLETAGTYIMLIGQDTRHETTYVKWEAEVAIEKECRIIGVNLDDWRTVNKHTCPRVIYDIGAMFVPFSPQIVAFALKSLQREKSGNWRYKDSIYTELGYSLEGLTALYPKSPPHLRR
jgi:MTH538 TIR-like domain (DUF1863)